MGGKRGDRQGLNVFCGVGEEVKIMLLLIYEQKRIRQFNSRF
jgi:hypothetical protein